MAWICHLSEDSGTHWGVKLWLSRRSKGGTKTPQQSPWEMWILCVTWAGHRVNSGAMGRREHALGVVRISHSRYKCLDSGPYGLKLWRR